MSGFGTFRPHAMSDLIRNAAVKRKSATTLISAHALGTETQDSSLYREMVSRRCAHCWHCPKCPSSRSLPTHLKYSQRKTHPALVHVLVRCQQPNFLVGDKCRQDSGLVILVAIETRSGLDCCLKTVEILSRGFREYS